MNRLHILLLATAATSCSHSKPPVTATAQPPPATNTAEPSPNSGSVPISPHVAVAPDLARLCTLHFNGTPQAPKFDFDRFELLREDRDVLDQVATCLTTGPLRGRTVQLVGRADPRGTEEYNLGLGSRRASSVRDYLERLGVAGHQLSETTRGALDATGTDESGWRVDRRVDLRIAVR